MVEQIASFSYIDYIKEDHKIIHETEFNYTSPNSILLKDEYTNMEISIRQKFTGPTYIKNDQIFVHESKLKETQEVLDHLKSIISFQSDKIKNLQSQIEFLTENFLE